MIHLRQTPLFGSDAVPPADDKQLALMRRLGIDVFPHHETLLIPLERIVVPGAEVIHPSPRLVRSIKQVGMLQMPAVELVGGADLHDPQATWQVIFGRRRVLAAGIAGLPTARCEAYERGTPQLGSLLALIENEQRSAAWIKEVQDLCRLIDEKVGMTPDDLAAFGFDRGAINERLKIAQLPPPILAVIFAGKLNEATAKKIARLGPSLQEKLANLVLSGETLSAEMIKQALRKQVNTGFVPLQDALAASMAAATVSGQRVATPTIPSPDSALSTTLLVPAEAGTVCTGGGAELGEASQTITLAQVLFTLKSFETRVIHASATQNLRLLTRSLIQQLEMAERDAAPLLYPHVSEVEEACHV